MEHKKISRALTVAGILATLGWLALFILYLPQAAFSCRDAFPELSFLFWPELSMLCAIGLISLAAMAGYFRIVVRIGRDQSFCAANARDMRWIAYCLWLAGALCLLCWLLPAIIWRVALGPAWLLFTLAALAYSAMGILAWGLGCLLRRAVALKEESDLTI